MAESKRYYWLKFRADFFDSKRIKKLRNMAGGDTYVIIYLKMQLKALKTAGVLEYTGIEEQFADELALDIDERPDDVRVTLLFLLQYGLCECSDNVHYYLPWVEQNTGSETASTQRWREWRDRKQVDTRVAMLESNTPPTNHQRCANAEKETEKDKEKETEYTPKGFDTFWSEYPVKVHKKRCIELWKKIKPDEELVKKMVESIKEWKHSKRWTDGYIRDPDTWLRNESWNDEVPKPVRKKAFAFEHDSIKKEDFDALIVDLGGE